MNMKNIDIVFFQSKTNPRGHALSLTWQDLCERCRNPRRTSETLAQYAAASAKQRARYKDNAGFIGARLADNYRSADHVLARTLLVMDMDCCPPDIYTTLPATLRSGIFCDPVQAIIYSTHSSTRDVPRLRLIIRPDREMTPEEYKAVCRTVANTISMECSGTHCAGPLFDHCSWGACQMFYWPSCSRDADYYYEVIDGEPLDVTDVLGGAEEMPPMQSLADIAAQEAKTAKLTKRAEAPAKSGTGTAMPVERAFCQAYTLTEAIEEFLPQVYRHAAGDTSRFDYIPGEGTAGLVVSVDENGSERACSFHSTDPAHGMSLTAYQLVGLHRFGVRPGKGYRRERQALEQWARQDEKVRRELARQAGLTDDQQWQVELEREGGDGAVKSTRGNVEIILENDPDYRGMLYYDTFTQCIMVREGALLPWGDPHKEGTVRMWEDDDDAHLRWRLQAKWGVSGSEVVRDALVVVAHRNACHPVRDYLTSLEWDGTPRLNHLWIDYIGARDTPLTRAITELFFVAAVARVMRPGCKFDYCPVLKGPQGIGKSTVLNIMGGEWFTDSLPNADSKDALSVLQGRWIVEAGEFMAFKRSERESVKRFITSEIDVYRPAYGRYTRSFPRQCVFCATTNEDKVLKGDDNRRLVPVECDGRTVFAGGVASAMDNLRKMRDQLWAEAVHLWDDGAYKLYLTPRMEEEARMVQAQSTVDEDDELRTALEKFVTYPQPPDWATYSVSQRQVFYSHTAKGDQPGYRLPTYLSLKEVIYEAYGLRQGDRRYPQLAERLAKIIRTTLPDWVQVNGSRHTKGLYGNRAQSWKRPADDICHVDFSHVTLA